MSLPCFPNETAEYRAARLQLLEAEAELRDHVEQVAALRRQLPLGGVVEQDYAFASLDAAGRSGCTRLSELFAPGKDALLLYGYMFGPDAESPCPMCTSFLDALDANAAAIECQVNLAVAARAPIERLAAFGRERGWRSLRLLSSAANTYQADYLAEAADGSQMPMANVFVRRGGAIHHFWGSELLYRPYEGADTRHLDMIWPLWNVLDLTPEGRGKSWYPSLSKDA